MVTEHQAYILRIIDIPYELDNINYYAREIGDFKKMLEGEVAQNNEEIKQWFQYFLTYAEIELEAANERLTEYRQKLNDYEQRQRELQPVQ
jgi:hypothetical protein